MNDCDKAEGLSSRQVRHVIWDWNGTLLDDTQAGVNAVNGMLRARRGARLTAITSGGTIPDNADYEVILEPQALRKQVHGHAPGAAPRPSKNRRRCASGSPFAVGRRSWARTSWAVATAASWSANSNMGEASEHIA